LRREAFTASKSRLRNAAVTLRPERLIDVVLFESFDVRLTRSSLERSGNWLRSTSCSSLTALSNRTFAAGDAISVGSLPSFVLIAGRKSERSSASSIHERSVSTLCKEVSTKRARADWRRVGVGIAGGMSRSVNFRGCSRGMSVTYLHFYQALNQHPAISLSAKHWQARRLQ
jgi:hypothetical protein